MFAYSSPIEYDLESDSAAIVCSSGTTGPSKCELFHFQTEKSDETLSRLSRKFRHFFCVWAVVFFQSISVAKTLITHLLNEFSKNHSGVCVSYGNHAFLPTELNSDRLIKDCIIFTCDSIYWTVGLKPIFNSIHHGATRIITSKPFSPELQLRITEKYRVTVMYITPSAMAACLKSDFIDKFDFSSVKRIIFYGAKLPNSLVAHINRYFQNADLMILYGSTETGLITDNIVSAHTHTNNINGGRLFDGRTIKIIDNSGYRCGPNIDGEICIKSKYQFLNYFNDPMATATAVDLEGFFHTGDIGHFDDNCQLFIEDRKKNVATVFYFENILVPSTIEECLIKLPDVMEVCVVGVPLACGDCLPAAAVVCNQNSNLDRNDVFNAVAGKKKT